MAADDFPAYCEELLAPSGRVQRRRMFGGHGLYVDGLFVAIIAFERLYLKADADTAPRFQAAGGERFVYSASGRAVTDRPTESTGRRPGSSRAPAWSFQPPTCLDTMVIGLG